MKDPRATRSETPRMVADAEARRQIAAVLGVNPNGPLGSRLVDRVLPRETTN